MNKTAIDRIFQFAGHWRAHGNRSAFALDNMKFRTRLFGIVVAVIAVVAFAVVPQFVRASKAGKQVSTKTTLTTTALAIHNFYKDLGLRKSDDNSLDSPHGVLIRFCTWEALAAPFCPSNT